MNIVMYLMGQLDRRWQVVGNIQDHGKWVTVHAVYCTILCLVKSTLHSISGHDRFRSYVIKVDTCIHHPQT